MKTLCNSSPLTLFMMLGEIGPITIGSRVRDTTSCVFVPHSDGAKLVRLRNGITKSCYSLKTIIKIPPHPVLEIRMSSWLGL